MRKTPSDGPRALQRQARALRERFDTVLLATASSDGIPLISYAPGPRHLIR